MTLGQKKEIEARDAISQEYSLPKIAAAVVLLQAERISEDDFVAIVVNLLRAARIAVAVKVDVMLSLIHDLQPVGYVPQDFADRDEASLRTVLGRADDVKLSARAQSFTANTLSQAARDFRLEIGKQHGATHWRWRTVRDSCSECKGKRGQVFPIDVPFQDHPNSDCYPELIFN